MIEARKPHLATRPVACLPPRPTYWGLRMRLCCSCSFACLTSQYRERKERSKLKLIDTTASLRTEIVEK